MMRPKVSWLIPSHNEPYAHVYPCLNSCRLNAIQGDQIVVVDDGSAPGYYEILREAIRATVGSCMIVTTPHEGVAKALNAGLYECTNDWIARIDADDFSSSNRLQRQFDSLPSNSTIHGCGLILIADDGRESLEPARESDPEVLFRQGLPPCYHPTWIVEKRTLVEAGGYPTDYPHAEDTALQLKLWKQGAKFSNDPTPMVYKRQHRGRVSMIHRPEQARSVERLLMAYGLA